jgi:dGTPase
VSAAIVAPGDLPASVTEVVGADRRTQLHRFITAMLETIASTGRVGLRRAEADALDAFRAFNYERIYLRPESRAQAARVIALLRSLTEWFVANPAAIGNGARLLEAGSDEAVAAAVRYVSGMTDRFALSLAVDRLGWDPAALPQGV